MQHYIKNSGFYKVRKHTKNPNGLDMSYDRLELLFLSDSR